MNKTILSMAVAVVAAMLLPVTAMAQSDFGIWYGAGAEKKLSKKWSVGLQGEFRTRNNTRTADRWIGEATVDYKPVKHLKLSAGYDFFYDNNREKITRHDDGSYNNWRPSYWGTRHRVRFDVTGSMDVGRVRLSLRERWQYAYRPAKTTTRYDFDNSQWEETEVSGKGKHTLRSRLRAEWNIPHCKIDPFASVEIFNSWSLDKTRYSVGADWRLTKHHAVGLCYRFQDYRNSDDNQPDEHVIGINYKFKF